VNLRPLVLATRPAQALKNLPVLAPMVFGHRLHDAVAVASVVACTVAWWLVASAGYLVNDVADRRTDAVHPRRRTRPVAAGTLSVGGALGAAAVLYGVGFAIVGLGSTPAAAGVLAAYAALTAVYTFAAKRSAWVGPLVVATGFVLRVLAGAWAAPVAPSAWILGMTGGLALALALAKQEAERRRADGEAPASARRRTDVLLVGVAAAYAAYTAVPSTVALHGTHALLVTAAPVALALARFRQRLRADRSGAGPAELVARDPVLLLLGAAWAVTCVAILR